MSVLATAVGGPPVCFPAIQDGPSSTAQDRSVTRSQGDSDHSTATGSFMVSGVDGSVPRRSNPAVRRGSNTADSRRLDRRRGDRDSSLPAIKSTRLETLRAILRAKGHSREAAHMMSRSLRDSSHQVYESHWARSVFFCRSKKWHVFRVRSHHFSTYMIYLFRDGLLPAMIISHHTSVASVLLLHWVYDPAVDPHIKLLFRACRLERSVQLRIMPKWDLHLLLSRILRLPFASECDIQGESWWRHSLKMVGQENCVPVSIGFSEIALVSSRVECRSRQVFVREREHPMSTPGISVARTWFPGEESTTVTTGSRSSPPESVRSGEDAVLCQTDTAVPTELGKSPVGGMFMFVHWNRNIGDIMKSHKPMDRGNCQGNLHSSWLRVWPSYCTLGQSSVSYMAVQLSGSPNWHPVSGFLEVIWCLPESLYRWWHVYTGSSRGCTTSHGSRTSSPSSIAYTICMQPLLQRS